MRCLKTTTTRSGEAGFSLFESLVALAIFSTVAMSTLMLISQNVRSSSRMDARTYAEFVAENVLVETYVSGQVNMGIATGEADMGGFQFDWQRDVQETGEQGLQSVTVRVSLHEDDQTLVLRNGFRRE